MVTVSRIEQAQQILLDAQGRVNAIKREGREAEAALRLLDDEAPETWTAELVGQREADRLNLQAKVRRLRDELPIAEQAVREADARLAKLVERRNRIPRIIQDARRWRNTAEKYELPRAEQQAAMAQSVVEECRTKIAEADADIKRLEAELVELTGE
jgi:chromosome segregation ATPase